MAVRTVGFIGSGRIGSALARLSVRAGLEVVLSNSRGPETLSDLIAELGPRASAGRPEDAASAGDFVVTSILWGAHDQLPADALAGRVVVDTMNYYPDRDGHVPALDSAAVTSSELVQRHLGRSKVVKAFNNVDWLRLASLARPAGAADRTSLPIAGDDGESKELVGSFLEMIGYDAVDIGSLRDSWRFEPGTPVYVTPYYREAEVEEPRERFLHAQDVPMTAAELLALCAEASEQPVRSGPSAG